MPVIATLEPTTLTVEPGQQASTLIKLRNQGAIVDRFDLSIVGPLAGWVRADPPFLSLFPGQDGQATITFAPPRAAFPRAGAFPFGVRVKAAAEPTGGAVEEGRVTVSPFSDATAEIVPVTSRASKTGRHEVIVNNKGNAPVAVVVGAVDPDRLVDFQVQPERFVIGPGEAGSASVRATARDTFWTGSKVPHPFNVEVKPGDAPSIPLRASLEQGPMLPRWVPVAGGLALAALIAAFALARMGAPSGPVTGAGESTGPGVTASPSASASAASSQQAGQGSGGPGASASAGAGGGGGSPTPTPSPTPGPFVLTIAGDSVQTGGALSVNCPPQPKDSNCLKQALDTVRALTTSLGGPYGGRGIVNPADTAVAQTLPVIMSRDVAFPFVAQDGAVTDQTPTIVIDLAPLLASPPGFAYAVVDSSVGPRRFVLPDPLARQLLDILYTPNPDMVNPMPSRSIPPFFVNFDPGDLVFDFQFSTPTP